jgi:hypothetical protein
LPADMSSLGKFEVRQTERANDLPSPAGAAVRQWLLRLTLESIKTGELTIPPLEVHYTIAGSSTVKTLQTQPYSVRITSVLEDRADPTKFRDIKPLIDVPVPPTPSRAWITWTAGGTAVAVAGLLLTVVVVKRRRRGPSPAQWALESILQLEEASARETTGAEAIVNETVDIIREFFELEFNVSTLPRTTREFLVHASRQVGMPKTACERLLWMTKTADEIKFARLGVGEKQLQRAFAEAKAFIAECESLRRANAKGAA